MSEPDKLEAGQALRELGGFELISKIGQGGMGAVFKARQKSLDRIVALKLLPPSIAKDVRFIERFQREARACAKLNHPNIVQGVDVGKDAGTGIWYFAMEFVDGQSALQLLKSQRVIPEERALKIARDIASALECAASNGMVHRDIKPDNILLTVSGEAKLADLGLARQIKDDAGLTQSGQAVGTPYYMAPEQVRGRADQIDARTDIYALGGTLFHLVTGQPPFKGETSAVIMSKHLTESPPKANRINSAVSSGCSRMIERMMQKDPAQRFQNPKEVQAQIAQILNGEDVTTGPRQPVNSNAGSRRRRETAETSSPWLPRILIGAGLLIVAAVLVVMTGGSAPPEKKSVAGPAHPVQPQSPLVIASKPEVSALAPVRETNTTLVEKSAPTPAAVKELEPAPMATPQKDPEQAKPYITAAIPAPAAPPVPAAAQDKLSVWPLADLLAAVREDAPAKAIGRVNEGNYAGKEAMLDALKLLALQRDARFSAIKNLVGQNVKLDTLKGPQNGKLAAFANGVLKIERSIVIDGEARGSTSVVIAFDDLSPETSARLAPVEAPAASKEWLASALTAMAGSQLDAADAALAHVDSGEPRDTLSAEVKRIRVIERESGAAAAWAKVLAHAGEASTQGRAKQVLDELALFTRNFGNSDFAAAPEIAAKAAEIKEMLERLLLGLDPRVLKLFKGHVLNFDAKSQVITIAYDLQTKEQTEDFIGSTWAPPGDTTGLTWKKGELKTFCKGTADRIFKMPQFVSNTLDLQLDYKKSVFAWKRYEVEISFHGMESAGKSPKLSFRGTDKGAFFVSNGADLKSNTEGPMFNKDGRLELSSNGQTLSAKVDGKPVLEYTLPKPNDHTGFWMGGGWDSGITFTHIQVSGRLDPVWLSKALESANPPKK
jgi:serine/threonine protein kinase